jgi:hypothetical protein
LRNGAILQNAFACSKRVFYIHQCIRKSGCINAEQMCSVAFYYFAIWLHFQYFKNAKLLRIRR